MKIKNFSKFYTFENYLQFLVLCIPVLLITGPFLPDFILSLCSVSYIIFLCKEKKIIILKNKFFYFFLFFLTICIISSILSEYQSKSMLTSFGYLRFGIFIFVIGYLVNNKKKFLNKLSLILILIFLTLFFDALFQKFTGSNILGVNRPFGRVTSLFGEDIKLGGYIMRFTPLLLAILIYLKSNKYLIISILFISIFLTLISGQRIAFLMTIIFLGGFIIFCNFNFKIKLLLFFSPIIFFLASILNEETRHRIIDTTFYQINLTNSKPFFKEVKIGNHPIAIHRDSTLLPRVYHMYYETSLKIFKDNIFFGSGPKTYKILSGEKRYLTISNHIGWENFVKKNNDKVILKLKKIHQNQIEKISNSEEYKKLKQDYSLIEDSKYKDWLLSHGLSNLDFNQRIKDDIWLKNNGFADINYPGFANITGFNSHPHNTYLLLLSETGLLGFSCIILIWIFSLFKVFSNIHLYYKCLILGIIINLFPFVPSGNFFNNWLSILYFYPLGFLLKKNN